MATTRPPVLDFIFMMAAGRKSLEVEMLFRLELVQRWRLLEARTQPRMPQGTTGGHSPAQGKPSEARLQPRKTQEARVKPWGPRPQDRRDGMRTRESQQAPPQGTWLRTRRLGPSVIPERYSNKAAKTSSTRDGPKSGFSKGNLKGKQQKNSRHRSSGSGGPEMRALRAANRGRVHQ